MRLTKKEKEYLFELTDRLTDKCIEVHKDFLYSEYNTHLAFVIYKKLRLELKGY